MSDPTEPASRESADARIVAVTMDDPVLGGPVRLVLGAQTTVLVGKNGAGKSLLLEKLELAALAAVNLKGQVSAAPVRLEVELAGSRFEYEYHLQPDFGVDREGPWSWTEVCVDAVAGREIWKVADGRATVASTFMMPMPPGVGLLHLRPPPSRVPEAGLLRRLLRGLSLVHAGVPRHAPVRENLRLQWVDGTGGLGGSGRGDDRMIAVLRTLAIWYGSVRERFDAVVEIGRRLQVLQSLDIQVKRLDAHPHPSDAPTHEAEVFVDGVNFGYLSDGTQRLIELVIKLVDPAVTVLLLEEPETSVHPGLLRRLLAELEALGPGKQLVISTHSPMVIDWTAAEDVRLVERTPEGVTRVRTLSADEQARLRIYLDDDLALSDFMLSGAMD